MHHNSFRSTTILSDLQHSAIAIVSTLKAHRSKLEEPAAFCYHDGLSSFSMYRMRIMPHLRFDRRLIIFCDAVRNVIAQAASTSLSREPEYAFCV